MTTRSQDPGRDDFAAQVSLALVDDLQTQQSAVDQHRGTDVDVPGQVRVIDRDTGCLVTRAIGLFSAQVKDTSRAQFNRLIHWARADLGTFDVDHDGNVAANLRRYLADPTDNFADPFDRTVSHVQPHHVHARTDQLHQLLFRLGGRSQRGNDLGVTICPSTLHQYRTAPMFHTSQRIQQSNATEDLDIRGFVVSAETLDEFP